MDTLSTALSMDEAALRIPEDPFVHTNMFKNYEQFRYQNRTFEAAIEAGQHIDDTTLAAFVALNPDFWEGYFRVGEYYKRQHRYADALRHFRLAVAKEITTEPDKRLVTKRIKQCERASKRIRK